MKKFLLILIFLILSYFVLYKIYSPRISAFGCFDDCFNFAAGYFVNHNKILYSEIFYNHQMLPAYLSSLVQSFSHPINIFDLVLKHRQFVLLIGFLFNALLIFRFGIPAVLFFLFFEFSKFYIFGDRFLGEGVLVYPLVYLIFIFWQKIQNNKINNFEYIFVSVSSWLVVFLRETFTPLSLLLFIFILLPFKKDIKFKAISIFLFIVLLAIFTINLNLKDYYFNLIEVNKGFFIFNLENISKIIFYPLLVLISGKKDLFWTLFTGVDLIFLFSIIYLVVLKKKIKLLFLFAPLVLSNIRVVDPGRVFYDAFHMVPFYGVFLTSTFLLISEIKVVNKTAWKILMGFSLILFLYYISSPQIFFREKISRHGEFFTNYSNILQTGEIIKKLSNPKDTMFVDGFDEVVYWVADRPSSYRYSMYTSIASNFSLYTKEKLRMFEENPPDFYYGSCPKEESNYKIMPSKFIDFYTRLNSFGKPSCVFVKKTKLKDITGEQWKKAKEFGFELPLDNDKKL